MHRCAQPAAPLPPLAGFHDTIAVPLCCAHLVKADLVEQQREVESHDGHVGRGREQRQVCAETRTNTHSLTAALSTVKDMDEMPCMLSATLPVCEDVCVCLRKGMYVINIADRAVRRRVIGGGRSIHKCMTWRRHHDMHTCGWYGDLLHVAHGLRGVDAG